MRERRTPAKPLRFVKVPIPVAALTIKEFCAAYRVSPAVYYRLQADGAGPLEHRVGRRVLISTEAAQRWQKAREAAARRP